MSYTVTFFSGVDKNGRNAIWETDGTASGTVEVAPLYGTSNVPYGDFTSVNGKVLFTGRGSNGLTDLFVTDGTTGGTYQMNVAGASSSLSLSPADLVSLGTKVLFNGIDTTGNYGLWTSDGTAAGTYEIAGTAGIDPRGMTAYAGKVLFGAINGGGLWVSDGTSAGTAEVAGTSALDPEQLTLFGGKLYFIDGKTGNLDVTDGTSTGTHALLHLGNVVDLTAVGSSMYFEAKDTGGNFDLFKTNGTAAGTSEVAGTTGIFNTLVSASRDGNPISPDFTVLNGKVYFEAASANGGFGLWVSDGSAGGTHEITGIAGTLAAGIFPSPGDPDFNGPNFAVFDNQLVFDGASAGGAAPSFGQTDLWVSNGTAAGTKELKGIPGGGSSSTLGLDPSNMTTSTLAAKPTVSGILFASAPDQVDNGYIDLLGTAAAAVTTIKIYNGTTLLGTATRNYGSFYLGTQFAPGTYANLLAVTTVSGKTVSQKAPYRIVTGITGQPYTDLVQGLDPSGNLASLTYYANGNVYLAGTVQHLSHGVIEYLYQSGTYFETLRPLVAKANFVSAGGVAIGASFYYANVQGSQPYTGYELDLNGTGHLVRATYTGVTTAPYSSYELDYVNGVKSATKYFFTDTSGAPYSAREVDYDFANKLSGQKFFYTNITGQFYTGREVDYDGASRITAISYTGITTRAYSSREDDYSAGAYAQSKYFYTNVHGQPYTGRELIVAASGAIVSDAYSGYTTTPFYSVEKDYLNGALKGLDYEFTNVSGKSYFAYAQSDDASGHVLQTVYDNNDSTHTIVGTTAKLTFNSIGNDTMTGGGAQETFVFQPLFGHDTITDFHSFLGGSTHDTISLSTKEFADFDAVKHQANDSGVNLVLTGGGGDTLTLLGMNKSQLVAGDFAFHA